MLQFSLLAVKSKIIGYTAGIKALLLSYIG